MKLIEASSFFHKIIYGSAADLSCSISSSKSVACRRISARRYLASVSFVAFVVLSVLGEAYDGDAYDGGD
jgi:hypothetical protein